MRSFRLSKAAILATSTALVCMYSFLSSRAQAPPADFKIEAFCGSYAPWGRNQRLYIQSNGSVAHYSSVLETATGDSTFLTISSGNVTAIYDTMLAVNFFGLNANYDSGAQDGSGIVIRVTASGSAHTVQASNIAVSRLNRFVKAINARLPGTQTDLNYGALNQ